VEALSARWDWYLTKEPNGKVVWCEIAALSPGPEYALTQVEWQAAGE
jgi:hypothetical protein